MVYPYSVYPYTTDELVEELRFAQRKLWRAWRYLRAENRPFDWDNAEAGKARYAAMDELMQACVRIVNEIHSL